MKIVLDISDSDQLTWTARCVAGFRAQGHTNNQVAEIMHVHRHTIERAVKALRAAGVTLGKPSLAHSHSTPQYGGGPQNRGTPNMVQSTPQNETLQSPNMGVVVAGTEVAPSDPNSLPLFPEISNENTLGDRRESEGGKNLPFWPQFIEIWNLYGKIGPRGKAHKKYHKLRREGIPHEDLVHAVTQEMAEKKSNGQDYKMLATFLGPDEHWKEALERWKPEKIPVDREALRAKRNAEVEEILSSQSSKKSVEDG